MSFFKKQKEEVIEHEWKITKKCLDLILESSKSIFPKEFGGLLRIDSIKKDTIIEVIMLPGTISGNSQAIFQLHMLPIDLSIVGTVHSHPSPFPIPSKADLELFRKHGKIHIITANPFNENSWRAYDFSGQPIEMKII